MTQPPSAAGAAIRPGARLDDADAVGKMFEATVLAMAHLAEPGESGNHITRIQLYVVALARHMRQVTPFAKDWSDAYIATLGRAACLHDIGNSAVPDRILLKPGALTDEELAVVKTHPEVGRDVIDQMRRNVGAPTGFLDLAREIAFAHQERWDGTGYPQGLHGDAIPLPARVMAIADAYDALTSDKVYRAGVPHDQAVQQIFLGCDTQFDPQMVDTFIEIQEEFDLIAQLHADSDSDLQKKIDYMAKAIAESP